MSHCFFPEVITIGELPEKLYVAKLPFADDFTQRLAWMQSLEETDPDQLLHVLRRPPRHGDFKAWLALAERFAGLHRELAADGLDFDDVVRKAATLKHFGDAESRRWKVLHEIQHRYLERLDSLRLWDKQTARLFAIEHQECRTEADIVLVGTVDMNRALRKMIDQVAERITSLVFAPEGLSDWFDEHGCVIPDRWRDHTVDVNENQIVMAEAPGHQADAVIRTLAAFDGRHSIEDITIGVPDERLVPYVLRRLNECGINARYGVGDLLCQSSPARLLNAIADFLQSRSTADYAALLRHPAIGEWLPSQSITRDPLPALDAFQEKRLPANVDEEWSTGGNDVLAVSDALRVVNRLLDSFVGGPQPPGDWALPIQSLLVEVFGVRKLNPDIPSDRKTLRACEQIRQIADDLTKLPPELVVPLDASDTLRLVVRLLGSQTVPPVSDEPAIELLGWLELPLEDTPALVVTGFNEGIVPSSHNADLFLPNGLRRHLNLEDNDRRYARDVYALSVLAASRSDLTLIAGRRTADNDPLFPSRLLFPLDEHLAERTLRLIRSEEAVSQPMHFAGLRPGRTTPDFPIPKLPELTEPVTSMRVTEFRDYLACPYRYFLKHRLCLKRPDDTAVELPASEFGTLLHDVLKQFGQSDLRESANADEISAFLRQTLEATVSAWYGQHPLPAVRIQIEQASARLDAFALWQAAWRAQGWRIEFTEQRVADTMAPFLVDDEPMYLRGQIDRIDRHEDGRLVILDYKTGDSAESPEKKHYRRFKKVSGTVVQSTLRAVPATVPDTFLSHAREGEWIDLQLPLYQHLARGLGIEAPLELGYVVLPRDVASTGERIAQWDEAALADADQTAADVIRRVRNNDYGAGPVKPPPPFSEEFAAICQDRQFVPALSDGEEETQR